MVKLYDGGVYLVNGQEIVPEAEAAKVEQMTGKKVCPDCYQQILDKEHEVVEYVRDHKGAKIPEICEATGAPSGMIKKMIREGRFEQIGVKMTYPCEKCGAPIISGKICQQCEEKARIAETGLAPGSGPPDGQG